MKILIDLYQMYLDGMLAAEFDKASNKMVNSAEVVAVMTEISKLIPEKLSPLEAARKMRQLEKEAREEAITANQAKVIDMRKTFQRKMSQNGGALGLVNQLALARKNNDTEAIDNILATMQELAEAE